MKITTIAIRVILGLLFMVSAIGYFFNLMPQPALGQNAQVFITGLFASGYLLPVVKTLELATALSFLTNRFIPLFTIIIFPITINILLFHLFMAPEGIVIPVFIFLGNLFLAYVYKKNYEYVLAIK
jgi:putative oxidoreductase